MINVKQRRVVHCCLHDIVHIHNLFVCHCSSIFTQCAKFNSQGCSIHASCVSDVLLYYCTLFTEYSQLRWLLCLGASAQRHREKTSQIAPPMMCVRSQFHQYNVVCVCPVQVVQ